MSKPFLERFYAALDGKDYTCAARGVAGRLRATRNVSGWFLNLLPDRGLGVLKLAAHPEQPNLAWAGNYLDCQVVVGIGVEVLGEQAVRELLRGDPREPRWLELAKLEDADKGASTGGITRT